MSVRPMPLSQGTAAAERGGMATAESNLVSPATSDPVAGSPAHLGETPGKFGDELAVAVVLKGVRSGNRGSRISAGARPRRRVVGLVQPPLDVPGPVARGGRPPNRVQRSDLAAPGHTPGSRSGLPSQSPVQAQGGFTTQPSRRLRGFDLPQRAERWAARVDNVALLQAEGVAASAYRLGQALVSRSLRRCLHPADATRLQE